MKNLTHRIAPAVVATSAVVVAAVTVVNGHEEPTDRLGDLAAVSAPPVSVDWERDRTAADLQANGSTAVIATVAGVTSGPPITAEDAGAPPGTPSLPREIVAFSVDEHVSGPVIGRTFDLVRVLPPSGVAAEEDEPYQTGEQYLLYVAPADMPGEWQPRAWQLVSLDGRLRVNDDGRLDGYLPDGPAEQLNRSQEVMAAVKEAVR